MFFCFCVYLWILMRIFVPHRFDRVFPTFFDCLRKKCRFNVVWIISPKSFYRFFFYFWYIMACVVLQLFAKFGENRNAHFWEILFGNISWKYWEKSDSPIFNKIFFFYHCLFFMYYTHLLPISYIKNVFFKFYFGFFEISPTT